MMKFGQSQSIKRVEDLRLLTGHGNYIDDAAPAEAWRVMFLRSNVAHGEITTLDLEAARAMPGVKMIVTAEELEASGMKLEMAAASVKNRDGKMAKAPKWPCLAQGRVRYVGEPIAAVVAETLDQARDAIEAIEIDYDALPVHMEVAPGGADLHEVAPHNVAFDWVLGDEAKTEAAFAEAAHRVTLRVEDNRIIVNAMEPRGCFAEWQDGKLHLGFGGQGVWAIKADLMRMLKLRSDEVRVTTPDVGGGFGMKARGYPEYYVVAQAARLLGHPLRWIAER
ncbi:xanthine dehydrogenase family protein molybdopterin-binding subunit, partial [Thioclava sp. BHET1]